MALWSQHTTHVWLGMLHDIGQKVCMTDMYLYHNSLGEACSHVAAVLFKVEACIRLGLEELSPTSLPCKWNQTFSKKVNQ